MEGKTDTSKKEKKPTPKPFIAGLALLNAGKDKNKPVTKLSTTPNDKKNKVEVKKDVSKEAKGDQKVEKSSDKLVKKVEEKPTNNKQSNNKPAETVAAESFDFKSKKNYWWRKYDAPTHVALLVSPEKSWYEQYPTFLKNYQPPKDLKKADQLPALMANETDIPTIEKQLEAIYKNEVAVYQKELTRLGMSNDQKWLNSVISSGTWSDKIAALTLRIQESPFHNLENLDLLIGIAQKKEVRVAFAALEALKDLFINNLLPDIPMHNLSYYQYILLHEKFSPAVGLLLYFENQLKQRIFKGFVLILENLLKSPLLHYKKTSLEILSDYLMKKSECEHKILIMIINKLGDSDGKIVTKTLDILKNILKAMPLMKLILIKEIKNFIYFPNQKLISIFHAIHFLLKIPLNDNYDDPKQQEIPLQLVECYISLFDKALNVPEKGSRLLTSLLHGINKTFPLLDDHRISSLMKYLDVIFKLVHTAPTFAASTQALMLLSYMTFATIKNQKEKKESTPAAAVSKDKAGKSTEIDAVSLQNRYYMALYSKLLSDQMLANTKSSLFLNLLYKSVKMDPNALRAAAFLKRISMSALITAPQVTAGLLFIISEVLQARPELKPMIDEKSMSKEANLVVSKKGKKGKYDNDEDEEDDDDEDDHDGNESVRTANTTNEPDYYLFGNYDANKRNPSYACMSEHIPYLHESHLLMRHFHPSVSAFATSLFTDEGGHHIQYKGDPLEEFTIMSFLNRFAYKNPKQQVIDELKQSQQKIEETEPINKQFESLLKRQQENSQAAAAGAETIAPDKRFFYKFFADRETLRALGKKKEDPRRRKGDDDEDDEEGSAEGSDLEKEIDDFADQLAADMMKHDALTRGEELGDDFDGDDFPDDDDFDEEEDDEDEEEEEKPSKNQKNNKKRKMEEMESEALDFESFRKEQEKQKNKKKTKKNSRADEDDDDIQEPEAYTDEFDQIPPAGEEDMEELDDDLMMIDDDDEDFDDFASKKVKKDKKGKSKGKKGRRDDDDDEDDDDDMDVDMDNAFADADLYEDQMEDNVQQFQFKAPAKPKFAVASDLMNDEDDGNANEKKGKGKQNKKDQKNNKNKNESKSNKKARKN